MNEQLPDGIYFAMDFNTYREQRRFSSSGVQDMLVSIPTFWARSWMNPDNQKGEEEETRAQTLGKAYHCMFLEPEYFEARFACEPDPADYPGALMTDTAVKAELKAMGSTQTKTGENAPERAQRYLDEGGTAYVWSLIKQEFDDNLGERDAIGAKYWHQIQRDRERLASNPEISGILAGGFSEVSILWTDESGIQCKARLDKLRADHFVDLKSFANPQRKPVNRCIRDQFMWNQYYIQARFYGLACDEIQKGQLRIMDRPGDQESELIRQIVSRETSLGCWYIFQEKEGVPNILAREIQLWRHPEGYEEQAEGARDTGLVKRQPSFLAMKADVEIQRAKDHFRWGMEVYGEDVPWYSPQMVDKITDNDFPEYWFEQAEM